MRNISLWCPQKAGRRSLENKKASRWIQKYIEFEKSKEREKLKKYNSTDLIKQHLCGFEMIKSLWRIVLAEEANWGLLYAAAAHGVSNKQGCN